MAHDHRDDAPASREEPRQASPSGGWDAAKRDAAHRPIRGFSDWASDDCIGNTYGRSTCELPSPPNEWTDQGQQSRVLTVIQRSCPLDRTLAGSFFPLGW